MNACMQLKFESTNLKKLCTLVKAENKVVVFHHSSLWAHGNFSKMVDSTLEQFKLKKNPYKLKLQQTIISQQLK